MITVTALVTLAGAQAIEFRGLLTFGTVSKLAEAGLEDGFHTGLLIWEPGSELPVSEIIQGVLSRCKPT